MDEGNVISDGSPSKSKERIKKDIFDNSPFINPLREVPIFKKPSLPDSSFKWKVQLKTKNDKNFVTRRRKNVAPKSQPLANSSFLNDTLPISTVPDPQLSLIGRVDDSVDSERLIDELIARKENELRIASPKRSSDISAPIRDISPTKDSESKSSTDSFFSSLTFDETELITPPIEQQADCTAKKNLFTAKFVRASDLISSENRPPSAGDESEPIAPSKHSSPSKSVLSPKSPVCYSPEHRLLENSLGDESEVITPRKLRSPHELIGDATPRRLPSPENLICEPDLIIPLYRSSRSSVGSESELVVPSKHRLRQKSVVDKSELVVPSKHRLRQKSFGNESEQVTPRKLRSRQKPVGDESEMVTPSKNQLRQNSFSDESELVTSSKHRSHQKSVSDESELVTPSKHPSSQKSFGDESEQVTPRELRSHQKPVGEESEMVTPSKNQLRQNSFSGESELVTPSKHRSHQKSVVDESELVTPRKHRSHQKSVGDDSELVTPRKLRSHQKPVGDDSELVTPRKHRSHQKSVGDDSELVTPRKLRSHQKPVGDDSELVTPRKHRSHQKPVGDESEMVTPRKNKLRLNSVSDKSELVTPSKHQSSQKSFGDESELVTPSKNQLRQNSVPHESEPVTPSKHRSPKKSVGAHYENQSSFYFSPKISKISLSRKTYSRKSSVLVDSKSPERSPNRNLVESESATPENLSTRPTEFTESQSPVMSLPSVPIVIEESEPIDEPIFSGPAESAAKSPVVSKDDEFFEYEEQPSKSIQDETIQSEDIPIVEKFSENEFSHYDMDTDVINQLSENFHSAEGEVPSDNKGAAGNNSTGVSPKKKKRNRQQNDEIFDSKVHPVVDNTAEFAVNKIPSVDQNFENKNSDVSLKKTKKKKKLQNHQQIDEDLPINGAESEVRHPFEELDNAVDIKAPSITSENGEVSPKKKKRNRHQNDEVVESKDHSGVGETSENDNSNSMKKKKKKKLRDQRIIQDLPNENAESEVPSVDSGKDIKNLSKKKRNRQRVDVECGFQENIHSVEGEIPSDNAVNNSAEVSPKKKKRNRQQNDEHSGVGETSENDNSNSMKKKKLRDQRIIQDLPNENTESEVPSVDSGKDIKNELSKKKRNRQRVDIENEPNSVVDQTSENETSLRKKKKRKRPKIMEHQEIEENTVDNPSDEHSEHSAKKKKRKPQKTTEYMESEENPVVDQQSGAEHSEQVPKKKNLRYRKTINYKESKGDSNVNNPSMKIKKPIKTEDDVDNSDECIEELPKKKKRLYQHKENFITKFVSKNMKIKKEMTSDSDSADDSDDDFLRSEEWLGREHYPFGKDHYSTAICYGDFEDAEIYPERWFSSHGFENFDRKILKEIFDFLKLDERLYEKIKNLDIKLDWKVDPKQLFCLKLKTNEDVKKFYQENFKRGRFSSVEDSKIMKNWIKFCKKYDFDKNDFAPFLPLLSFNLAPLTKKQKVNFILFLAQGLERPAHKCYTRFVYLTKCTKSGKFSTEEDRLIKFLWKTSPLGRNYFYSLCGFLLHRNSDSIYVRCKSSIPDFGGYGIYYDENIVFHRGEKGEKIKQDLIDKCRKYSRKKLNRKLPSVIEKVAEINKCSSLQVSKLFHLKVQPMLASRPINRYELWAQLIETIKRLGYSTWTSIDWVTVSEELDDLGPVFLYSEFRKLIRNFVMPRYRRLLSDVMKKLDEVVHTLVSGRCDQELKVLPNKS